MTAKDNSVNFLAFVPDAESLSTLQRFALSQGWNADCIHKGTVADAVDFLATHPGPDFLLIDVPDADSAPDLLDQLADVCDASVRVIVTSTVDEFSFYRWLTDIGVHHYLLKPLTDEALLNAISTAPVSAEAKTEKLGKLYSIIGTRGGVGTSTIALNLAAAIGVQHNTPTALLDLEAQWGTQSLMLDLEPGRGLREALAKPDRVDGLFMERVMLKYKENFSILSSEEPLDEPIMVHADAAHALIEQSRKKFAITLAELPRDITPFTQEFLRASDHILIVTELTLLGLRDAMRLADLFKEKMQLKRIHFVASRVGLMPKHEMKATDFEKSIGSKFYGTVPFDAEVYGRTATGEIEVLRKHPSAMGKAVQDLAGLLHHQTSAEASKKPKAMGWLKSKK